MLESEADRTCCTCGSGDLWTFFEVADVPTHSVLLLPSREEAIGHPRGDIRLTHCRSCGFIFNSAFDPSLMRYSKRYEGTQAYSPTFDAFHQRLADDLVQRYEIRGRDILEIGCGQGEFLNLLCERGGNRGVGFDPAYDPERAPFPPDKVRFIDEFYSELHRHIAADFVVCKMTLEHIKDVSGFVASVRRALPDQPDTLVFFQVPSVESILARLAFWDIYYEHCSYFGAGSLRRLFARSGFDVTDVWTDYGDQYLMLTARPAPSGVPIRADAADQPLLGQEVTHFADTCAGSIRAWREEVEDIHREGKRIVLWGGGSKAVAFLTTLQLGPAISYVVDINPHKHGTFTPGTGHAIVGPAVAAELPPDVVLLMNPVYRDEVARSLRELGIEAAVRMLEPVGEPA